ncbi:MAG: GNAT family N-acetyltransferase [Candidatus Thorarchaeota archaeon]|nr:GNAT family N-acetyltransferase [Candidatus Thorarchaeota archaeon]
MMIREGKMWDCNDLLTVYQTTRWSEEYTAEQVKQEHRLVGLERWGWLVAEKDDQVIGEIIFRVEPTPNKGLVGIVRSIDVDIRFQKQGVGRKLVSEAESILKKKQAQRIVIRSPPSAYNFWMKLGYFKRGQLTWIEDEIEDIPVMRNSSISTHRLRGLNDLPDSLAFSHFALADSLAKAASDVIDKGEVGRVFEFKREGKPIGAGVVVKRDAKKAEFVADIVPDALDYFSVIVSRTARAANPWTTKTAYSVIPDDSLGQYIESATWDIKEARDIPVMKLL